MSRRKRAAEVLPVEFFTRPAEAVARGLLGAVVVSDRGGARTAGRIVETEAYLGGEDPASHGYKLRRTVRNESLFGPPGLWYVYLSYGIHWCANLVCREGALGSAVLLRALEPLDGREAMRERRGGGPDRLLCSGPGKLCQALAITREVDGWMMEDSPVVVRPGSLRAGEMVAVTPRIGITQAADWPLRFTVAGSPWVSRGRYGGRAVRR